METIYAKQEWLASPGPIIFLAGPTPRRNDQGQTAIASWRPEALQLLSNQGFAGTVLVPEDEKLGLNENDYTLQVEWEEKGLTQAHCILFWIPRRMDLLPGLTTNDEWGTWKRSGKVVLGVPSTAERCRYQIYYAKKYRIPHFNSLEDTVRGAISLAKGKYSLRSRCWSWICQR